MENLSAAKGDSKGEINLHWDSVENAVSYVIEIANSNQSKEIIWKVIDIISYPQYTVRKLKSNRDYLFRVASINDNGQGEISGEIMKKAP
ncbi:MAG: fibronectin type III domain-containing protein [Ignavibacteria bacterium]|jgi:hypothetical protein|nr:fibronectin type III domain-containing protein [Ignavibacteria bacterium]